MFNNPRDPLTLLREIERRSNEASRGLPVKDEGASDEWAGIGFVLGRTPLLAATGEVSEILWMPEYTRLPGVKPWVLGIANVRGSLLPVLDTKSFLRGEGSTLSRRTRLLVIDHEGLRAGLLVDDVVGLRQFPQERRSNELPDVPAWLRPFVVGSILDNSGTWGIFSTRKLAEDPGFVNAAA
ncbi:MAG: chemotaxis protein CheW [Gammaproteobacteria bacterium]